MTLATSPVLMSADAEKALRLPIGAASPLWMMIGTAAMMGAVAFWATRWMRPVMPVLEMPRLKAPPEPAVVEAAPDLAAPLVVADHVTEPPVLEADVPSPDPVNAAPVAVLTLLDDPEPMAMQALPSHEESEGSATSRPADADDLTLLKGIGPKLAQRLAERGLTGFARIAALTPDEIALLDREMKLMGRIERDNWVAQARTLAGT